MNVPERTWRRWSPRVGGPLLVAGILLVLFVGAASWAQPQRDAAPSSAQGTVERFTTAPRGEVDGAVLDDGTWLHWPPHMEDRFSRIVKEGDRVQATGRTETGPRGDEHFEVQNVTNLGSNARAENPDFAADPPPPPWRGRRLLPARGADREQRLRDLEEHLDQLRREIRRLRRDD